jgi:crotonobetainyl-CoA:carnitine CoA-transferase CaiB-like acyl-CoA transferase
VVQALDGLRVIDMAAVFAGPGAARHLADFGADVIKGVAPAGDGTRAMGWKAPDGDSYFWKLLGRGKRSVVLDLKSEAGLAHMHALIDRADVLIENFRPGTLERLGLDPAELLARNPGLVVLRVTGFGQDGPYSGRAGFATTAEALSGWASLNGEPGGAPLLPPTALTDDVTALAGAFAIMVALRHRDRTGEGQVIDISLLETMMQLLGALPSAAAHLDYEQPRLGAGLPYSVPRGTYQCADGEWVAISASAESVAARVLEVIGLGADERYQTFEGRAANRDALDAALIAWIAARPITEVVQAFSDAHAAIAPVLSVRGLRDDPHVRARGALIEVAGVEMQAPVARLSRTPGRVRFGARALGADTDAVLAALDAHAWLDVPAADLSGDHEPPR